MDNVRPPCYDPKSKEECPDRMNLCYKYGRDKCDRWVEYQKKKSECDLKHRKEIATQAYFTDTSNKRLDRYLRSATKGRKRIGSSR